MAQPVRLRSRRHFLRLDDLVRHDDDHLSHRHWTSIIGNCPKIRREQSELFVHKREDESHEGVSQTFFGHFKLEGFLRRDHDSLSQQDGHFQGKMIVVFFVFKICFVLAKQQQQQILMLL